MKTSFYLLVSAFSVAFTTLFGCHSTAQSVPQTVRGTLTEAASQAPLVGATVLVSGSNSLNTTTDADGTFRLMVVTGRIALKVSFTGYGEMEVPDIMVDAGKEVILNLTFTNLNEVTLKYNRQDDPTVANNEMATSVPGRLARWKRSATLVAWAIRRGWRPTLRA